MISPAPGSAGHPGLGASPPYPPSLDTRQQLRIGLVGRAAKVAKRPVLHRPARLPDALASTFRDPRERALSKFDLADVLEEVARRAAGDFDYERAHWFDERAGALRQCNTVQVFLHRGRGHGVATPLSCHVRGCPDCERGRVGRLVGRFDELAAGMVRPVFWTWTLRNVPPGELAPGLAAVKKAFTRLRRRSIFRGGACRWRWRDGGPGHPCHPPVAADECGADCPTRTGRRTFRCPTHPPRQVHANGCPLTCDHRDHDRHRNCPDFAHRKVAGGVAAVEVTWSKSDGSWHPHLHALVDAPWIAWSEMRDQWVALTCTTVGCRHVCTDCRAIASLESCRSCSGGQHPRCTGAWSVWVEALPDSPEARAGAIREVLKYVGKPAGITDSLDPDRIGEFVWSTRSLKAVSGFGELWRKEKPDDDGLERADELVIRFGFARYYVPKTCPHCREVTTEDDWAGPMARDRLGAVRIEGSRFFGWADPPPASPPPPSAPAAPDRIISEAQLWHV